MAVVKSAKDVKTTTVKVPGVGTVNTKTGSVVKTSTPAPKPAASSLGIAKTAVTNTPVKTTATPAKPSAPAVSTVSKSTSSPKPVVSQTVSPTVSTAGAVKSATNNLINAKDDLNRAQIASSVAKAPSANVNPETVKKIEQNVATSKENLAVAKQQAVNVGINPDNVSPYKFTPPTATGTPTGKATTGGMAEFKQMEYAENQPDNIIEMIDSSGQKEAVNIDDLLTTGTPEDWQEAGVVDEMGNPLYQDSYGRMITQADYYQLLGRSQNAIDMTGISPQLGFNQQPTGGGVTERPTGGMIVPSAGGKGGASGSATNSGQLVPNPSDSSNLSNMGDNTTSMMTDGGSESPIRNSMELFANPYFDKLASMQFSYNEQDDPEYQNSVAAVENAVTQAMVGRGGMYSSVYQAALSSKIIDLGIQFRKQRYAEYAEERNFVLTMAKTTFDMQMSMANYDLDIRKMNFDQNMTIAKFKLDQENSAFSRAMQMKEYNLKVSQISAEQNKVSAQSQLYVDQVNLSKDRQLFANYMATYDKYNAGAMGSANVPPQLKAFLAANGIAVPAGKSVASTKAYIDNAMKNTFDTRTDYLGQRALALGDIESYSQSLTQMSGMQTQGISGYDRDSSTASQTDAYYTRSANIYANTEDAQGVIDQYNKNPDAFKATYGAYYASQLLSDARKVLTGGY